MPCPSCGTPNEAGRKFCGECGTKLTALCPNCGASNGPTARFCGECGTGLVGPAATSATAAGSSAGASGGGPGAGTFSARPGGSAASPSPVAERRLVSILFVDLVGFTTISEGRDHEEVRELLSRYFDAAREIIERYGGTVEKFIGDAVMAVWGAPTAHEDDAERAVRAALDVVDAVRTLGPGLEARAGVLSGEAAVTLGAQGQGMVAGDLVNTASRLQSVAPSGTVLVGETTHHATSSAIAYEPAGDQLLKGKAAPVPAFRALRVVAERGGRGRGDRLEAAFVGRDSELRLMKDLLHATSRERRVRLVSITGQAGIGKSRLAWELRKYVDGLVEKIWWHEGRSPAYGEGITFWALGEMVRARAGLLETDDLATTKTKIAESVATFVPEPDERERVEVALQTLLGVGDAPSGRTGELFGAWRTYFERMAANQLVVLLFEDLHWADPGLLDFVDHILEWSRNVPILIVTLARPELLERRADWGAGRRNFLALDLGPLDNASMRQLLAGFVPDLPDAAARSIIDRAEGIPLYAVETVRMLVAEGRLRERDGGGFETVGELGELAVPETLHALIAARLDALDPAERALVQDASVLGQSFTPAGLAAVSGLAGPELDARLRVLVRSDLLQEEADPRSPERGQYAFVQALIREVAYSTLALRDRRARHLAAARFFESLGDDELAGALAAHYLAAYRASPAGEEADALASQARLALRGAASRARALGSPAQAITFLEQAREVAGDDAERAELLEAELQAAFDAADFARGLELAPKLRAIREASGDRSGLALAIALESELLYSSRRREEAADMVSAALSRFEDLADDPNVLRLEADFAASLAFTRQYERAMTLSGRVLAAAERLGMAEMAARMLLTRGTVAFFQGRLWESITLTEGARRLAEQHGLTTMVNRANASLANTLALDDPRATVAVEKEVIAIARREGRRENEIVTLGNMAEDVRRTGDWDWILAELEHAIRDTDRNVTDLLLDAARANLLAYRGEMSADEAATLCTALEALDDLDVSAGAHDIRGSLAFAAGDFPAAVQAWFANAEMSDLNAPYALPKAGMAAVLAGDVASAELVLDRLRILGSRGRAIETDIAAIRAGLAGLAGDVDASLAGYRAAWAAFRDLGLAWDQALLALSAATVLGTGEPDVAGWVAEARQTLGRLRCTPVLARLERAASAAPAAGRATPARAAASSAATGSADQAAARSASS